MLFGPDRRQHRAVFVDAWRKRCRGYPLEPLERLVVGVIEEHPQHQALMLDPEALSAEFASGGGPANPFLHMGMHIALREQVATDRPPGISGLYRALRPTFADAHALEHAMLECLGQSLRAAQRRRTMPDEASYLECVREMARKRGVRTT